MHVDGGGGWTTRTYSSIGSMHAAFTLVAAPARKQPVVPMDDPSGPSMILPECLALLHTQTHTHTIISVALWHGRSIPHSSTVPQCIINKIG
jgi:hypothetical protein